MRQDDARKLLSSPNEIIAALNAGDNVEEFTGGADEIIDLAIKEAGRRLTEDPGSFGETALVKLVSEANKAADRKKAKDDEEKAQESLPLLDRIDSLPIPHVQRLLDAEIERLQAALAKHEQARDSLKE